MSYDAGMAEIAGDPHPGADIFSSAGQSAVEPVLLLAVAFAVGIATRKDGTCN